LLEESNAFFFKANSSSVSKQGYKRPDSLSFFMFSW